MAACRAAHRRDLYLINRQAVRVGPSQCWSRTRQWPRLRLTWPSVAAGSRRVCGLASGFYSTTACRKNRGSGAFREPICRPAKQTYQAIVVKSVDVAPSKRQRVGPSRTAKLLNLKIKLHRVLTGDPLGPRRMREGAAKVACFQLLGIQMVGARLLKLVEPC
jgi:hypothetical protein